MEFEEKIVWRKPDYEEEYGRMEDDEIDRLCLEGTQCGDVKIEKATNGRKIFFYVWRIEKIGELTKSIDTLTRGEAIEYIKELTSQTKEEAN